LNQLSKSLPIKAKVLEKIMTNKKNYYKTEKGKKGNFLPIVLLLVVVLILISLLRRSFLVHGEKAGQ